MPTPTKRRRVVVDDTPLANAIGARIKRARSAAGLTQSALAGERYTKAYISALEHGQAKPSMAALSYLAPRLGTTAASLMADASPVWDRLSADLRLASGDITAALDGYETVLADATDHGTRAEILAAIAQCRCRLERAREAIRPASEAADLFERSGRSRDAVGALYWLASAQYQSENLDDARSILTTLLGRIRDDHTIEPDMQLRVLVAAAMVERVAGEPARALAYLEEARGLSADLDDRRRGSFFSTLAATSEEAGDHEAAIRYGQQALVLLRAADADLEAGHVENQLALTYLANGNLERAADLAHRARQGALARHEYTLAAHLADTEAQIALGSGDPEAAVAMADEAIAVAARAETPKAARDARVTRGRAHAALGHHDLASADFEAALADEAMPAGLRRTILSAWADSLAAIGQHERAFALAREALDQR
jgi:transcriptional regulator with XRE-family HTH domain